MSSTEDFKQSLVLVLISIMMHKELSLATIAITTGSSVDEALYCIQSLINLQLIEYRSAIKSNPIFRLIDFKAAKKFLEALAKVKVEANQ